MSAIRIDLSDDPRDFQRRDWRELVRRDPDATFFHTPGFLKLYWEEFGEEPQHLLLAFASDEAGTQVGAVAFELIGDVLRFLGGTEVTDYLGPVGISTASSQSRNRISAGSPRIRDGFRRSRRLRRGPACRRSNTRTGTASLR